MKRRNESSRWAGSFFFFTNRSFDGARVSFSLSPRKCWWSTGYNWGNIHLFCVQEESPCLTIYRCGICRIVGGSAHIANDMLRIFMGVEEKKNVLFVDPFCVLFFLFLFFVDGRKCLGTVQPNWSLPVERVAGLKCPPNQRIDDGSWPDPPPCPVVIVSKRSRPGRTVLSPPHEPVNDKREKGTRFSSYRVAVFFFLCAQYNTSIEK